MRTKWIAAGLGLATTVLGACIGCGDDPDNKTDLAKLPPPSQAVLDREKTVTRPQTKPRFGAPPKSELVEKLSH